MCKVLYCGLKLLRVGDSGYIPAAVHGGYVEYLRAEALHIPFGAGVGAGAELGAAEAYRLVHHLHYGIVYVLAHEHPAALAVDYLPLAVHYVVVLEDVLADVEVVALYPLLRRLYLLCKYARLYGDILIGAYLLHEVPYPLAAETLHQVVLHGYVKPGGAGVSLTARPAAELVVYTAGLMALCAYYMQAAHGYHLIVLGVGFSLISGVCVGVLAPGRQYLPIVGVGVARRLLHHALLHAFAEQLLACKEIRVAAQQYIGTSAGHVGGYGHVAVFTGLGYYLRLTCVELGIQHLMLYPPHVQHMGKHFALFDGYGSNEDRPPGLVDFHYLVHHGVELGLLIGVYDIVEVLPGEGLICGYLHHVKVVYRLKLLLLRLGGTGHARQLPEHAEIVLEGYGGKGAVLPLYLYAFLCFEGLMQPVAVAPAQHETAGELIHYKHLAVLHYVVLIPLKQGVGLQGLLYVVVQLGIFLLGYVVYAEEPLGLLHAPGGKGYGARLYVRHIVAGFRLLHAHELIGLAELDDILAPLQTAYEPVRLLVHIRGFLAVAGYDKRGAGLIDQYGVHLVHYGVVKLPLHHLGLVDHHVVPEVVKAELVVGAVGDVAGVGLPSLVVVLFVNYAAHGHAEEFVYFAHPLGVALRQVVVHGDYMHAVAGEGVEVGGQSLGYGLAFARLHLGYTALMQHYAAQKLYVVMPLAYGALCGLADYGECLRQQVVLSLAVIQACPELVGLSPELLIRKGFHTAFQIVYSFYHGHELLNLRF